MSLVLFIVLKTGVSAFRIYWDKTHPAPPPPPDTLFGKLPKITFPKEIGVKTKSFQLETAEGDLPAGIPITEKVYFIPQGGGKFLSLERATNLAKTLGLNDKPEKIDEDIYLFKNSTRKTSLTINVLTENFEYDYSYLSDQTLINPPSLPTETEANQIAKSFLEKISKLSGELKEGEFRSSYWKIVGSNLAQTESSSEADFSRVDIFRKKVADQYPVVPPRPEEALVSVLISGVSSQNEQVVEVKYVHFESDREKFSDYPIKMVSQAWEELKSGNYFLASFGNKKETGVTKIRRVYLGYYEPPFPDKFLQPVFVFQGDNDFYGYVPAITPEWLE